MAALNDTRRVAADLDEQISHVSEHNCTPLFTVFRDKRDINIFFLKCLILFNFAKL